MEEPIKFCEFCGKQFYRSPGVSIPTFSRRRFCSHICANRAMSKEYTYDRHKAKIRKQSQRNADISTMSCAFCGSTENVQRHHPDYNSPDFIPLCHKCHVKIHIESGTYRRKQEKKCVICGKSFIPHHSKNHKTCSRECLSELGRRNAMKRWHGTEL